MGGLHRYKVEAQRAIYSESEMGVYMSGKSLR